MAVRMRSVLLLCVLVPWAAAAQVTDAGTIDAGPVEADAGAVLTDAGELLADTDDDGSSAEATGEDLPEQASEASPDSGFKYTADLSDAELARLWKEDPAALGSISIGRPEEGRLINAMPFPEPGDGGAWSVIVPESCWTTKETADQLIEVAEQLRAWLPDGAPVRIGQVSASEGGFLPPHITHQNGRDIDIGLFYPGEEPYRVKEREKVMDVPTNWAFVKALLAHADVQYILLDKRVQKVLYDYALKHGEDRATLDKLFNGGPRGIFHHARRHRDHFHVRLFNPRAQELAYRLAPLMPVRPDENVAFHKVKKGDTLGGIAWKYGSTVKTLQTKNHLTTNLLRIGQIIRVPLRGPCTDCPVPPLPVVPPRIVFPPRKGA